MRFPKETRALIHQAEGNPVTIPWPAGESEPQKGRVYWMQSAEDAEAERKHRAYSPETCADVLGGMHRRSKKEPESVTERQLRVDRETERILAEHFGGDRDQHLGTAEEMARDRVGGRKRKHRRRTSRAPLAGSDRIFVIDVEILDIGWEVKAVLYEDPDPVEHLRLAASVPAGPDPIDGFEQATETEPEQMPVLSDHDRRREEEEALKIEHKASVDHAHILKAERHLHEQRRKGKRVTLAEEAVERAQRRADLVAAEISG